MLSYQEDILRRRRNSRIFWIIVFIFSTILYFFFQWKYLNVLGWWQHISVSYYESWSTLSWSQPSIIRSFGIINIRTIPRHATINSWSGKIGQNTRQTVDYGSYSISIDADGYLPYKQTFFSIDNNKPYFIENISLLPTPIYQSHSGNTAYTVNDDVLIGTKSGLYMSIWWVLTGKVLLSNQAKYLGDNYFYHHKKLFRWDDGIFVLGNKKIANFIDTCSDVSWKSWFFYCQDTHSIITKNGLYFTGITQVQDGMFLHKNILTTIDGSWLKDYNLTGSGYNLKKLTILDDEVLTLSWGQLLDTNKEKIINMPLDTLYHRNVFGDDRVFIGKKDGIPYLISSNQKDPPDQIRIVPLPIALDHHTITTLNISGNLMIRSSWAILFLYRGRSQVDWIVDGKILGHFPTGAIYKNNDALWSVRWDNTH